MKRCKKISAYEGQILECLTALNLTDVTIPYTLCGDSLVMEEGRQVDRQKCSVESIYRSCLKKLYSFRQTSFSPGIYAFYGAPISPKKGESYSEYLRGQIKALQPEIRANVAQEQIAIADAAYARLVSNFKEHYAKIESVNSFELLHGDLHIGNILEYRGEYRLIDFEFARFGPKACEIAFLLCWEYIVGLRDCRDISSIDEELQSLCRCQAISSDEVILIKQIYIPIFIVLAMISSEKQVYRDSVEIAQAVEKFALVYFQCLD